MARPIQVLAMPGSLRALSSNHALLHAAAALAPADMAFTFYEGLGTLPHFNPDLDEEGAVPPPAVAELRSLVGRADALVLSVPEYAHGVPGSFKNALDWLVSGVEILDKPVLLLHASPSESRHAQPALIEILRTMSARVLVEESLLQPFLTQKLDSHGPLTEPAAIEAIRRSLLGLRAAVELRRPAS